MAFDTWKNLREDIKPPRSPRSPPACLSCVLSGHHEVAEQLAPRPTKDMGEVERGKTSEVRIRAFVENLPSAPRRTGWTVFPRSMPRTPAK